MKTSAFRPSQSIGLATVAGGDILVGADQSSIVRHPCCARSAKPAPEFVVQANVPENRTALRTAPSAAPPLSTLNQVAETDVPTVLDTAAHPALEGIGQRTLLDVSMDLFTKLEASWVTNRDEFFDSYFATLVKQDEMATLW